MDGVVTMTVPPTLPSQARDSGHGARQTVSIRSSPPTSFVAAPSLTEAGATVFVEGSVPVADSAMTTCRSRIPEVQPSNGFEKSTPERNQHQLLHQGAHVVKIRINPNGDNGKVISTVRLNPDQDFETTNGQDQFTKTNEVVSIANNNNNENFNHNRNKNNNLVNERAASDTCVRISVGNDSQDQVQKQLELQCKDEMVQRGSQDTLNSSLGHPRSGACFYYSSYQNNPLSTMGMSSGQCSPSETLDSGTCSDLDGTPPPLPKKKNSSTVILGVGTGQHHDRTNSLTSSGADVDSDDNESSISCDSLNCGELPGNGVRINGRNGLNGKYRVSRSIELCVNDEKAMKESNDRTNETYLHETTNGHIDASVELNLNTLNGTEVHDKSPSISPSPSGTSSLSKASSTPRVRSPELDDRRHSTSSSPIVRECTYEERKQEQERLDQESAAAEFYANYNRNSGNKYIYDDDRFYKFHLNEMPNEESTEAKDVTANGENENDECFAGYNILDKEAIRSAKGTVRGVKNRVRAGIATFLQKPASKNYKAKDAGKVVVYTTTMSIVRETYYRCMLVKQILRTHMVKYEERDMYMSTESQTELRDRIGCSASQVPQLFIDGEHIGDADAVERLNESGELRLMLRPYKSLDACSTCKICGGYRLLPCPVCNGSKKSLHRNDFTAEFVALKCMNCDEVGLIRCQHC